MSFEKLSAKTTNFTEENIKKIAEIFPNVVTESEQGKVIDFDALKQELTTEKLVEGYQERYALNWPGKAKAKLVARTPTTETLRPYPEESVNFATTENLYIEGDNLVVLKLLQESYLNKIKMIYIDPPYNTGKDFIYKDNFARSSKVELFESGQRDEEGGRLVANLESNGRFHSDWLSMMYPRLRLAKNLLTEDGVIFISIDDNEVHNLRKICDEIFGESNFIADLTWENKEGGGSSDSKHFRIKHEYILVYSKNKSLFTVKGMPIEDADRYKEIDKYESTRGRYQLVKLDSASIQQSESLIFEIISPDNTKILPNGCWRWGKKKVEWGIKNDFVVIKKNKDGQWAVYTKQYLNCDNEGNILRRTIQPIGVIGNYSTTQSNKYMKNIFKGAIFQYSKPYELVQYLLQITTSTNDIILDFFSGSATTAHAVMQLNSQDNGQRKFIMVQLPEKTDEKSEAYKAGYKNISEIGKERIRRAGKKLVAETAKNDLDIGNLDIGFRVLKLDTSNMEDVYFTPDKISQNAIGDMVDNIKKDRSALDLLWGVLIDWGVDLTLPVKKVTIAGKECYLVDEDSLCACFEEDIDEAFIKELVKRAMLRVVFRDSGFVSDDVKENAQQIFKQLNPNAEVRVI